MSLPESKKAFLVLEDGSFWSGYALTEVASSLGEIVFTTAMTGYQETLTDPSYAGQIVVFTAPHIGNTGMNEPDKESERIWPSAVVIRDPSPVASSHRATSTLQQDLTLGGVGGIWGVDTRAITRRIRSGGAMRSGIFIAKNPDPKALLDRVLKSPSMQGQFLSPLASTPKPKLYRAPGPVRGRVVLLDLGVKSNTLRELNARGLEVWLMPYNSRAKDILDLNPDALFYSNGPGDPASCQDQVRLLQELLARGLPYFGICFGNQLLARALGFKTRKLFFGHRGINQPVWDKRRARVEITSQNHGFAVDLPLEGVVSSPLGLGRVEVSHYSLNDGVVEGIRCLDLEARSVQYHPESAAGPHDSRYLFDDFYQRILDGKKRA